MTTQLLNYYNNSDIGYMDEEWKDYSPKNAAKKREHIRDIEQIEEVISTDLDKIETDKGLQL